MAKAFWHSRKHSASRGSLALERTAFEPADRPENFVAQPYRRAHSKSKHEKDMSRLESSARSRSRCLALFLEGAYRLKQRFEASDVEEESSLEGHVESLISASPARISVVSEDFEEASRQPHPHRHGLSQTSGLLPSPVMAAERHVKLLA
jgi:hypothetical protein